MHITLGDTPDDTLAAFTARAAADPGVAGLVLSGSRVHEGMPTVHSDYDLHVILRDRHASPIAELDWFRSAHLDLVVIPLAEFRTRGMPGRPDSFARYSYVHAEVLLDRLDGTIARILDEKRTLGAGEARAAVDGWLDAYVNQTYRSLKSYRDGRPAMGHLDAAESVPYALEVLFALHRRVRPYNKYLQWELERSPLGDRRWDADRLLPVLRRLLADGDPHTQRTLFMAGAVLRPLEGGARIAPYMVATADKAPGLELLERSVNGVPGLVAQRAGVVMTVASFDVSDGRVTRVWVVRNPEKLRPWAWS